MKKTFTLLVTLIMLFCITDLMAQEREIKEPVVPFQTQNPTLYATDVYLSDNPLQDQRNTAIAVAFNGWLFAAFTYYDPGTTTSYWQIMKSVDDGATWTLLASSSLFSGSYQAVDIEVTGNTIGELVVYLARVYSDASYSYLRVSEYYGNSGAFIRNLVAETVTPPDHYNDISIASDYKFPAYSASPFSVAIAYSLTTGPSDFIGYRASGDGGVSITTSEDVTNTGYYTRGVSISYARSQYHNFGRYFVAWETTTSGAATGHIWVAHTEPEFTNAFTTPFQLDNLVGSADNLCFNPTMCTQFNNVNNTAGHFTAVVMMTRDFGGSGTDYDVITMYNVDPTNTDTWTRLDVANTVDMDFQGDMNFDPAANNFLVTWCALTEQNLKYIVQGQDLGGSWIMINSGYNNLANLANPYPKVEINPVYDQVAHVWIGERPCSIGAATFDAEYSTVGIPPSGISVESMQLKVYPNPCNTTANIAFNLVNAGHVSLSLVNMYGQTVRSVTDQDMTAGEHILTMDVSSLPAGCYHFNLLNGSSRSSGQIVVTH